MSYVNIGLTVASLALMLVLSARRPRTTTPITVRSALLSGGLTFLLVVPISLAFGDDLASATLWGVAMAVLIGLPPLSVLRRRA